MSLPQLTSSTPFVTDGGLETRLVFQDGVELAEFAAFPLLADEVGTAMLAAYYTPYLDIAERHGAGIVLDTPTWRASLDWAARLGFDAEQLTALNQRAVALIDGLRYARPGVTAVTNGVIGPRGDGYVVEARMSAAEAAAYHGLQARAFAEAGADMISAITMTYADEAIGVARAAEAVGLASVVSFTVETDGRLPSGQSIGDAIAKVDDSTGGAPAYYMLNCAHPTHFLPVLDQRAPWLGRIRGVRANASKLSHAELDAATELDRGDIDELAGLYGELASIFDLCVVGGCCGTDHDHVGAIAAALAGSAVRQ
ncbi:MAG TPA: homocysteine S-methyltransferase family protein [Ilumatobacter sp.]|nr:homocysteine S-methyltransferase family protein [Ilumatobacter sp.]